MPSYVCHSNGGIFLKACSCKANQVHESRVEADRRADGVRLESSSRAKQSKAKFTRGEADCRADGVRLECRRDFSLRMVKGRPATPLVPGRPKTCKSFFQMFSLRRRGWSRGGQIHPSSQNSNLFKAFYRGSVHGSSIQTTAC